MLSKIDWLNLMIGLAVASPFGCSNGGDEGVDTEQNNGTDSEGAAADNEIEIVTWWTEPGEADALNAMIDVFRTDHPAVSYINVNAYSSGEAYPAVREMLAAGTPPDVLQAYNPGGPMGYGEFSDDLEQMDSIYESEGWYDSYPTEIVEALTYTDGHQYIVPVQTSRINSLFYNTNLVDTPPADLEAFFTLAQQLQDKGIVPLAISRENWVLDAVFRTVIAATGGSNYYVSYCGGSLDHSNAEVIAQMEQSVDNFIRLLTYVNDDDGSLTWSAAAKLVYDEKAAMYIHGDWAKGYYTSLGWSAGIDFGAAPALGTDDLFLFLVEGFVMFKNGAHPEAALNFEKAVGSPEGQSAFNLVKGGSPTHSAVDVNDWDSVAVDALHHFQNATYRVWQDGGCSAGVPYLGNIAQELYDGTVTRDEAVAALL